MRTPGKTANNTAFLFLMNAMPLKAKAILETFIGNHGGTVHEFANLALAEGLLGNARASERFFKMADWDTVNDHDRAVVQFNKATLSIVGKNFSEAKIQLKKAFELSRKDISVYCEYSEYIKEACTADHEIRSLVEENRKIHTNKLVSD